MTPLEQIRRQTLPPAIRVAFDRAAKNRAVIAPRTRAPRSSSHLFDDWPEIARRVRAAKTIRLFLDFDGTLAPYCPAPEQARLSAASRAALVKLARNERVRVAIVSGRRRASLAQFVKVPGVALLGLYGWEKDAGGMPLPPRTLAKFLHARVILAKLQAQLPEIHIEDKGVSLAVHFRGASAQSQRRARARLRGLMPRFRPEMHLIRADNSWEVAPRRVRGKGHAVRAALKGAPASYLAIYAGDDRTDEPAFAALRGGITVRVGPPGRTSARFRLNDTGEVLTFLKRLEAELP